MNRLLQYLKYFYDKLISDYKMNHYRLKDILRYYIAIAITMLRNTVSNHESIQGLDQSASAEFDAFAFLSRLR